MAGDVPKTYRSGTEVPRPPERGRVEPQLEFIDESWKKDWKGMPEFDQRDLAPFKSIYVHFESVEGMRAFAKLVGQTVTMKTQSIWYPKADIERYVDKQYIERPAAAEPADDMDAVGRTPGAPDEP